MRVFEILPSGYVSVRHSASDIYGVVLVNFQTAAYTVSCINSLLEGNKPPRYIFVLDNSPSDGQWEECVSRIGHIENCEVVFYSLGKNVGFAAGCNYLVCELLKNQDCQYVGFLNNDAVALASWGGDLLRCLKGAGSVCGMAGGRMHKLDDPSIVDTLGICIYASLMPADRHSVDDPFWGPTGGCAMMTRGFIENMLNRCGYLFDERFFCYCEDTDLVVRARLMGYKPAYTDKLLALHKGQASAHQISDFISYHGLRNSILMHAKLIPAHILCRYLPSLLLAHVATFIRYAVTGRLGVILRVYRDAIYFLPQILTERNRVWSELFTNKSNLPLSMHFYRRGYILGTLFGRK